MVAKKYSFPCLCYQCERIYIYIYIYAVELPVLAKECLLDQSDRPGVLFSCLYCSSSLVPVKFLGSWLLPFSFHFSSELWIFHCQLLSFAFLTSVALGKIQGLDFWVPSCGSLLSATLASSDPWLHLQPPPSLSPGRTDRFLSRTVTKITMTVWGTVNQA